MTNLRDRLSGLQRPKMLISAARHGLMDYCRDRDLRRLMRMSVVPTPSISVARLLSEEAHLETIRCEGDAGYCITRHIDVLIALMAEARLLPRDAVV